MSNIKPADVAVSNLIQGLDELEKSGGTLKWIRGWVNADPQNAGTGSTYHGFNSLRCSLHNAIHGYAENLFVTLKGCKDAGGRVTDDEFGKYLVLVRPNFRKYIDEDGDLAEKVIGWIYFKVWNIEQTQDCDRSKLKIPEQTATGAKRIRKADTVIKKTGAVIKYGGASAHYVPSKDIVCVPKPESFNGTGEFYATTFHELVHWTGHESREKRFKNEGFGTENYAREELVAEFGGFALCAVCGIDASEENALAYIQSWKKRIKSEPSNAVVTSVSQAQKAVRRILGTTERKVA
jgi:antirestriction protein ArdC